MKAHSLNHKYNYNSQYLNILIASSALIIALAMAFYPQEVFFASVRGLKLWWEIVFPSLLPFFIMAEIMLGLGIVHFLGVLLEPVMRPVFNLPGEAAFVVAMGYTSGFPLGAALTAQLRRAGLCTRLEGERLLSFTNNPSPLFLLVAVPVGMLGTPAVGIYLLSATYLVNLTLGILLRFYGRNEALPLSFISQACREGYLRRALTALAQGRKNDGRPFGKLLRDAVYSATSNLMVVGGFIIFFSVFLQLLEAMGIMQGIVQTGAFLSKGYLSPSAITGLSKGFWELTLGCHSLSQSLEPSEVKIALLGLLLGWGGLSVHAQVASMLANTDLGFLPFFLTRIAHSLLSALLLYLGFKYQFFAPAHLTAATLPFQISCSTIWYFSLQGIFAALFLLAGFLAFAALLLRKRLFLPG